MGFRFYQAKVMADTGWLGTVEAAVMKHANTVLNEPTNTPNHANRLGVAEALFQGQKEDIVRFVRLFAWRAVFEPSIQSVVYDTTTKAVTAEKVADADLDAIVAGFWNTAATPQPPAPGAV